MANLQFEDCQDLDTNLIQAVPLMGALLCLASRSCEHGVASSKNSAAARHRIGPD